jgi:hypothetical protein
MTEMRTERTTVQPATPGGPVDAAGRGRFTSRALLLGSLPLAFAAGQQALVSALEDDDALWTNVGAVVVASLLFGAIAFAVAQWAMRGSATRQVRTVIGLAVFTVLVAVPAWWSAAPVLVGLQTWLLGQVTGVGRRPHGNPAARAASVVAAAIAVGLLVFVAVVVLAEQL